ncbi:glycosyltransferase family 4 protein [Pontibacter sp. SGAir0037]|uniref:glycosyltransferase family 4 protein n=1 Tax=Pontibacter sp. SGAir0037 TaxID=2571030 RepID=UPI0010CD4D84|nr:glycosyltransferase family 4 protein [Pontibacter sp. SGAir0037]QCR22601.1 group 1 glycosyl transferase [Pontibacter sp. SGAir0037]
MAKIVHIADIDLNPTSGMGRVGYHWKIAFENAGHEFVHIGKKEIGKTSHPSQFPRLARSYFIEKLNGTADVILAHEPVSGFFTKYQIPVVLFSHGIEQREWELRLSKYKRYYEPVSLRSRVLFPLWRLRPCNKGLRGSKILLLSNSEDKSFVAKRFKRRDQDTFVFRNGIYPGYFKNSKSDLEETETCTIAFNGTWIKRKGIDLLVRAASILAQRGVKVKWFLFGVVFPKDQVLAAFPENLHDQIEVVSLYKPEEEQDLYSKAEIFVLPSFFEGQSLALLQAMASQMCCITSSCCAQIDLIKHMQNGLLFNPGDATDLANQLQFAVENKSTRQKLAANAQASVQDYRWESVSEEIVNIVKAVL